MYAMQYVHRSLLLVLCAVALTHPLPAQSPAPPLVPIYGFDSTEFIIGGWTHTWPDSCVGDSCFGRLWQLADHLGVTFLRPQLPLEAIVVLADTTNPHKRPEHKLLVVPPLAYNAGFGMELEFYTFNREMGGDTTNNPYHRWRLRATG